jgi:predicted phosphodiesterase
MLEIFLSDIHYRYHDVAALRLVKAVMRDLVPDIVFLGGDILDHYALSKFARDPRRRLDLQDDLNHAKKELKAFRKLAPNARFLFLEGNHEYRLQRYLWSKAPEVSILDALTLPELLDLRRLGIEWLPTGTIWRQGELHHIHGDEIGGGSINPARTIFLKAPGNIIFGHYHKLQVHYHRTLSGSTSAAFANGCLCTLTPEYLVFPQWVQGFTLIRYGRGGLFHIDQIPIFRHQKSLCCLVEGKLYRARKTP